MGKFYGWILWEIIRWFYNWLFWVFFCFILEMYRSCFVLGCIWWYILLSAISVESLGSLYLIKQFFIYFIFTHCTCSNNNKFYIFTSNRNNPYHSKYFKRMTTQIIIVLLFAYIINIIYIIFSFEFILFVLWKNNKF